LNTPNVAVWWVLFIMRTLELPFSSVNIPIHYTKTILYYLLPICIGGAIYSIVK